MSAEARKIPQAMQSVIFKKSNKRRAAFHNYKAPAIYHITLTKSQFSPIFGQLTGHSSISHGEVGCPHIALNKLGLIIAEELKSWPAFHPVIEIYQYSIMPDHIHILLRIREYTPKPLGYYVGNLTGAITRKWRAENGVDYSVFEPGFNDRIIGGGRSLDTLFRYIRDNPRRLAVRRENPDFFRRVNGLDIAGHRCRAYGNMQLLENPFMEQVVVHRTDSADKRVHDRERWIYTAANGGVLVSPFISPAEKAVRDEAEAIGGKIILITNAPMGDRYKPAARDFALCEAGRLLILSPEGLDPALTRDACLAMNGLAANIAADGD